MLKKGLILTVMVVALTALATAADLTGKWVASVPGFDGSNSDTIFRFKQSGDTVTGRVESARGDETISEGKVTGDSISFMTVERLLPGVEVKTIYKGTISGSEIKLTRTMDDGTGGASRGGLPADRAGGPPAEGRGGGRGGRGGPFGSGEMLLKKAN